MANDDPLGMPYPSVIVQSILLCLQPHESFSDCLYLLSIGWVFQARTWQNPWVEGGLFTLIGGMGLLWCGVCMWFLTEYAHLHYLCSKVVSALVVFLWNFVAKKWLLFHR